MTAQVLIVDDDAALRRALADRIQFWGHAVQEAGDMASARALVAAREFDLILLDLALPDGSGLDLLRQIREEGNPADVVVLTAHGSVEAAVAAIRSGAADFLEKPADFELLQAAVTRSLERRRLERVNRALAERTGDQAGNMAAESPAMKALLETAVRAAQSRSTVLLTGESGSGKQVLAGFLHRSSPRRDGPFVYVNCVAISDDLIESTLFGHEKGAFTGAVGRKPGRLEAAAGGTAFLDEIGDITPRLQAKLLHFLESGEFERVGGTRTLAVDCRIIAATHRNLAAAVAEGRFREDLYYRLNVIELRLPPLRERRPDIPLLAAGFLARCVEEQKLPPRRFAPATLERLVSADWPGNVRQLRNAVERMVALSSGEILDESLLPPELLPAAAPPAPAATPATPAGPAPPGDVPPPGDPGEPPGRLREALRAYEKTYIARVLATTGGNQTRAAAILGLQRTWLNRRIRELGLSP